jgi:hypothetical protein
MLTGVEVPGCQESETLFCQCYRGAVDSLVLVHVISLQMGHILGRENLLLTPKIVQNVRGMFSCQFDFRISAFMFRREVGDFRGHFQEITAPIVGLPHNALPGFRDMVFNPDLILQP